MMNNSQSIGLTDVSKFLEETVGMDLRECANIKTDRNKEQAVGKERSPSVDLFVSTDTVHKTLRHDHAVINT